MALLATLIVTDNVVNRSLQLFCDFAKRAGSGLATDVGTRGNDGFLETVAEFMRKLLGCDADAHATVLSNEVGSQTDGMLVDDRKGRGGEFHHVPNDVGTLRT